MSKRVRVYSDFLSLSLSANLLSKSILCTHLTHRIVGVHFYVRHVVSYLLSAAVPLEAETSVSLLHAPIFRIHDFHDAFLFYYSNVLKRQTGCLGEIYSGNGI